MIKIEIIPDDNKNLNESVKEKVKKIEDWYKQNEKKILYIGNSIGWGIITFDILFNTIAKSRRKSRFLR